MSYELYRYMFIVSTILAGLMLLISVILFIRWNIPKVVGDISGHASRSTRRSVKEVVPAAVCAAREADIPADPTEDLEKKTILLSADACTDTGFEVEVDITFLHTDEVII